VNKPAQGRVSVQDVRILELPKVHDPRGNLTFMETERHVPFPIQRVYYLYDVPGGESRAGHALRNTHQFLVAVSGSFTVVVDDGASRARHFLNRSWFGLYVPPMIWREIEDFSSGAVCLALASTLYDAADYHRDYEAYCRARMR